MFVESLPHKEWQEYYLEHLQKVMVLGEPLLCEPFREYYKHQFGFHSEHDVGEEWDEGEED